jgi:hypothetical protein
MLHRHVPSPALPIHVFADPQVTSQFMYSLTRNYAYRDEARALRLPATASRRAPGGGEPRALPALGRIGPGLRVRVRARVRAGRALLCHPP